VNKADPNYIGEVLQPDPYDERGGFCMDYRQMDRLKDEVRHSQTLRLELPNGTRRWHVLDVDRETPAIPVGTKIYVEPNPPKPRDTMWICKIGARSGAMRLASGVDEVMRKAAREAFRSVTGMDAEFIFSGWGGDLTEAEKLIVDDRVPEMMDHHIFAGPGGACMSSHEIEGLTQDLENHPYSEPGDEVRAKEAREYYGGRWFIAETMTLSAQRKLAALLGLRFKEKE
jgi:hypothetical protein